jgi:hypothetical protein
MHGTLITAMIVYNLELILASIALKASGKKRVATWCLCRVVSMMDSQPIVNSSHI